MCNRATERTALGSFNIDMDPLVIASGLGELVDTFLGYLDVVAVTKVFSNSSFESFDSGNHSCSHVVSLIKGA